MSNLGVETLHAHVQELHKERRKPRFHHHHGPVDRAQARLDFEQERDLWWRHAAKAETTSEKTHDGFNLKQLEKELRLSEEREWMKKHKKERTFEFTIAEKKILREWFDLLDMDHSGTVTTDELQEMLLTLGLAFTTDETLRIIRTIDADGSGCVDFDEFIMALTPQAHRTTRQRLDELDQSSSFTGLKKSMEAQSQGLLDAKTHVSIERRRFLVDAIMMTDDRAGAATDGMMDAALIEAVDKQDKRHKHGRVQTAATNAIAGGAREASSPTKQRLHGLEDVIARNARARREAKMGGALADERRRKDELQAEAKQEVVRRLAARQRFRLAGGLTASRSERHMPLATTTIKEKVDDVFDEADDEVDDDDGASRRRSAVSSVMRRSSSVANFPDG
ncbi:Aste57867_18174 [Aphanomyces stellatus]|uniref:Aste57867_18174 protein n=1 Tax=Aphanomyces stellatus TaxID=120398 RepID=A0A485L9R4_9STRA|nr:hypothetical protein As57867_018112 [Aphanomyces stellatus]VFT94912.1 Aste57867_18174 [Aphanomyces stellatus]